MMPEVSMEDKGGKILSHHERVCQAIGAFSPMKMGTYLFLLHICTDPQPIGQLLAAVPHYAAGGLWRTTGTRSTRCPGC